MKHLLSLCCGAAVSVFLAASAHADDSPQANRSEANIFKADMSNPDLAAVITSFQDVCLPFITHKTELPQSLNQQHHVKLLARQGYEFQARDRRKAQVIIEPGRQYWKPASQAVNKRGETIVYQTGEINNNNLTTIPARVKTFTRDIDSYAPQDDKRQTVSLWWNYASQNHPAKRCQIKLDQASIPSESFEADFIEKDADWLKDSKQEGRWSQCTIDGADKFIFKAERKDGHLSLSVTRNDLFTPKFCGPKG